MEEWESPQSDWNRDGEYMQPDWRGGVHKKDSELEQYIEEQDKYPDMEAEKVKEGYCLRINRTREFLGKHTLEKFGKDIQDQEDMDALLMFRLSELYLDMFEDPRLMEDRKINFYRGYGFYDEGIMRLRAAQASPDIETISPLPINKFKRIRERLADSNRIDKCFKECIEEGLIIRAVDTEGIEET